MASADSTNLNKAIVLVILMITMTQVGYLENLNPWTNGGEALEDAEPVVAHSPSTSVMYGNNSMWTSTIGPIKHAEYIALAYDAVLFQAAPNKNSMKGCPMAYNASNATVWQPNTGSTSLCAGMVGRYVAMIDDITYFTYRTSTSQVSNGLGGDLYAYNPGNDTIYLISNQNGRVQTGVGIGRTIYFTSHTYSPSFAVNLMSYNVDNQTTSTLSSPGFYQDRLIVVGSKILTYSPTGTMGSEAFNTENNTWYSVPSLPSNGIFGDPAPGVVSNGQLLFVGTDSATVASSTSGNGSEYWIYDSNNDTAWPLGDFCATTACNGGLPFHEDDGLPQIRNGMDMYFITRSYDSSTSSPSNGDTMYDLWGYSTLNATTWHMTNLTATFNNVGSYNTGDYRAHIKLAMLANGDFVISSSMAHPSPTYESAFYSPTNDTIWQPNLCSSCGNPQGTSGVDAQHSRLLGVYGNTVYFAKYGALLAYNVENQTAASQIIPGATSSYLNGAPVLFGSTFAMAHHCGDGSSNTCPNGQRNTLLQWAPESVTVSDAWNLTPGQRIDGPITGGNGIHFDSGVGVQSMTASAAGAELPVGLAMTDITFEYIGPTTYGNYSTWEATNINSPAYSMPGASMQILVGDTFYFDASDQTNGTELWAYDTSNHSEWRVDDIRPGSLASQPGTSMSILVGDTIYFSADDGSTGKELWAHDTSNHSAWRVDDINSGSADSHPGNLMELLIGDTLYFSADDGTTGRELWAHNTSNSSDPWQVADINSGVGHGDPGKHLSMVIDDVLYFSADDGSTGGELYAYNTSNGSDPWLVADLFSGVTGSSPGHFMQVLVDDIIYFDARGGNSNGIELWSYDTTDHSTQRVTDINSGTGHSRPGAYLSTLVGDTIYFSATDGTTGVELWAYDTSNHSTWRVADINDGSQDSKPGEHLNLLVGDTIYFSADDGSTDVELWAHDTSNHSTWLVDDICSVGACNLPPAFGRPTGSVPGYNMQVLVGDTFYFDAFNTGAGAELWAHDTSNDSTWNVAEMTSGTGSGISAISSSMLQIAVGDTLYFSAQDGSNSMELWAHRGAEFTPPPANVNGASSCSSSPSLPLGLSIDSSTCTISGTPTVEAVNETYTVTAVLSGVTYQTTVWISSAYLPLVSSVEGANLSVDVPMTNITFQYNDSSAFTLANPSWTPTAVSTSANGPMGVYAADVDGDGDLDIVTASKTDSSSNGKVTWWENGGSVTWTANDIATAVDARSVYVEDIDGDGDLDVVAALFAQDTIKLYLNSGASNPTWTASNIDTNANGATDVHVADMDGDGDLDVVSSSLEDDTIAWYKNDGQASPGWTSTNIDTNRQSARAVDVADMDGDGDLDIVTASSGDDTIAWYANGGQSTPSFTKTDISSTADAARDVRVADMDGDGDLDIVSASYGDDTIAWYENNGQAASWSSGVDIVTNASGAESVFVADLDNDGDLDIVSGSADDDTVAWYENDGQTDPSWDAYDISTSYDARGIHIADMDGDGDLDILSVSHNDNTVALFEQTGTRTWPNSIVNVIGASSCTASPNLPTGLSIDSSTCTISGTPTVETINRTYTVTAVISGVTYQGSVWLSSSYLELTPSVEGADLYLDVPMADITFHYNASTATTTAVGTVDGQITTYGNGSVWNAQHELPIGTDSNFVWGGYMSMLVGDTLYFDGDDTGQQSVGRELFAFNTSNETTWLVKNINPNFDSYSYGSDSHVGQYMCLSIGDTIYFNANDGSTGNELWAHNTTNQTTWQVADIYDGASSSHPGGTIAYVIDDTLYFAATNGSAYKRELMAYNTSNLTLWTATDINPENGFSPGLKLSMVVGDTIYFDASAHSQTMRGIFAYDTSNHSWWRASSFSGNTMQGNMATLIGDTIYFDAFNATNKHEVMAFNTANETIWQVSAFNYGAINQAATPGNAMEIAIGDTLYFNANDGINGDELWAYTTTNRTVWLVDDINHDFQGTNPVSSTPGQHMSVLVGDVLYFDAYGPDGDDSQQYSDGRELWAYNTSNHTTWQVADFYESSYSNSDGDPGEHMAYLVGDTIYFSAEVYTYTSGIGGAYGQYGVELVAHDTSNGSTWLVADIRTASGYSPSNPGGYYNEYLIGDTLYFNANGDHLNSAAWRWHALQPAEITSSGSSGTCSISPSLPTGLNLDSSTCTISGTPTAETSNTTYTVTAVISNVTYQGSVWLSTSPYATITSAVEGAALNLGEAMTPITLNYTVNANVGNSSGSSGGTGGSSGSGSGSGSSALNASSFVYANDKVSLGDSLSCGILDNGELKCWGYDHRGALGDGGTTNTNTDAPSSIAIDLGTGRTAVAVSAGHYHVCAILDNGDLKCWGNDNNGALGDGGSNTDTNAPSSNAIDLGPGRTAVAVSAGSSHTCAILDNGDLKCWGDNWYGQVGNGGGRGNVYSPTAVDLGAGRTAVAVSAGADHTCVLLDNDDVKCWGEDNLGQLGYGPTTTLSGYVNGPTIVLGLYGPTWSAGVAVALAAGEHHTCAILDNGDLKCWGGGSYGQLGTGNSYTNIYSPPATAIDLGTGRTAVAVSAGGYNTCAILDNGDLKCWGADEYGALGDGGTNTNTNTPTAIDLGTGRTAVAVSVGKFHTCTILDNGDMKCWGRDNQGQLGDGGSNTDQGSPVSVSGSNSWDTTTTLVTWETHPALPAGMSISAGTISGTPSVYALNQTYTIYANQSGYSTTHELYFSVDTTNAHTVVENQTIDPIGFHPPFDNGTTCWTVSPGLPGNLSIDSSTGEITGSVNGTLTNSTYTVTANHNCSGGSSGNGTTWIPTPPVGIDPYTPRMADYFMLEHDDVIYFDALMSNGRKAVYAFSTVNGTMWNTYDLSSINSATSLQPGYDLAKFVGDDLFFTIKNSTSSSTYELWVYSTSNGTTWRAMQQTSAGYGLAMEVVIGDRLYFSELAWNGGSSFSSFIGVYDTSNHSYWNYSTTMFNHGTGTCDQPGANFHTVVGDTIYFDACDASQSYGNEMYAFNTVNGSYWRVTDLDNGTDHSWPGKHMHIVIDDVIYFDAQVGNPGTMNAHALWAYNTSNGTIWLAADVREPGYHMKSHTNLQTAINNREPVVIGDTMYFDASASPWTARTSIGSTCTSHAEIYAYNIGNQTAWCVADAGGSGWSGTGHNSDAGQKMLSLVGDVLLFDAETGSTGSGTSTRQYSLWAHNLSNGSTWEISTVSTYPDILTGVGIGFSAFSTNNALYFSASNSTVGREVWGYDVVNQTYWLVNDTCPGSCHGVSGGDYHTLVHQGVFYSPVRISQNGQGEQHILSVFNPVPSSSTSSGGSGSGSGSGSSTGTSTTETFTFNLQSLADYDGDGLPNDLPSDYDAAEGPTPGLVADTDDDADGLLDTVETNTGTYVDSSNTGTDPLNPDTDGDGICDGPNAVAGVCIAGPDTNSGATVITTPVVLVNNSAVSEISPFVTYIFATYGLSPELPTSMQFDASNGSIWGTPDMLMTNTTYTMWANLSDGTTTSWTFFLEVLEDLDGDGMPDVLPGDYNATNDPIRTPGLEEDLDDDGDGYNDTAETDTGLYLDGNNTGTDPRDPDTDDDGICDGPGTVPGVCTAGPDLTPFGPPATVVAVNNTMIPSVPPYYAGSGLTYEHTPDLPAGLTIDPNNGFLMGVPTETIGNTTITVYANDTNGNTYSWDFTIEVLEDSDGDGLPDSLPSDYDGDNDSIRAPPGLTEDLDDDNDGMSDEDEILNGTEPLNPDTDGDGFCDGINAVAGVCFAGPDPYPNDANLPLDTDGDGLPDDDSDWTGPPYADDDDDNDGFSDASEDACGSDSLDASSIPADIDGDTICDGDDDDMDGDGIDNVNETGDTTVPPGSSPINPDTDGDGICDGPESPVTSNCTAGPDMFPLDPSAWEDTDGDGYPNELFPPSNSTPPLEEDLDDDNDGWSDIDEVNCGSDPVNASDMPVDENGDGICDVLDLDWDDDGIPNVNETDTGVYVDESDTGTDPWNPDTDGDGFCDGPFAVSNDTEMICAAGPDPFPHDPNMPMDTDGDGLPNELPEDYTGNLVEDTDDDNDGYSDVSELNCDSNPLDATSTPTNDLDGDGLCDAEDPDVDGDGLSNETELAEGSLTSYMNADTDGDGVCDGPSAPALPAGICVAGPDAFPDDAAAWLDTDGDGDPDELVDGITTDLVLDTDDDNDGWEDVDELACGTDTKDVMSTPFDGDDDGICDVLDTQTLGYTINEVEAEMFEAYVNQSDFILMPNLTGMEPGTWTITPELPDGLLFGGTMARSGDTGMIYGIPTEASPMQNYTVTADNGRVNISFTFGLGVLNDFDGDRVPDEPSLTGLEEDLDDDNDGHSDIIELKCGTDPVNQTSIPDVDEEGNCIEGRYAEDDSDDGNGFLMCLMPLCLILLLALLLFALLFRDKVILMGPEPENTTSDPAFLSGEGTKADPFVLKPVKALKAGSTVEAKETISITNMSPEIRVNLLDLAESTNDKRFRMYEVDGTSEEPGFNLEADDEGRLRLRFVFDDSDDPTYPGDTYEGLLKLGKASVYLSWTVEVKEDKRKMNKIRKEQEAAEKAEKEAKEAEEKAKAEAEAKAAEEKAAKEAEKKAKAEEKAAAAALAKKEKEEAAAKKKEEAAAKKAKAAEEKAAKEAEEAEAKAKAEAEAKAAEEKAAKEAEKKAKAEEKAAAAAAAKKAKEAKEEAEAKKKAEAEAKAAEEKAAKEAEKKAKAEEKAAAAAAAKKAKEEEEAKKKADADAKAAAKKVEKKPAAAKEAKKQEELQRVKKRAKSIDFKVIGEASSSELKSEVKKGATTLEVANAKDFAESGSAEINDAKGSNVIAWTGKDGNTLTGVSGVTRLFAAKAVLMVKDDLQVIKGIGPFIEEKLNALGITTYRQLANMTAKLETQVNEAIEFFPGRVKRDQWVAQAKILLGMDAKLDEKALKQAEELERVAQKAEGIDFAVLGVASASEADDLQKIKGIGPFIAEKLNALGIYKFSQLANMTSEIEEEVNVAIEFFPGRVKRDEWAKQAKELAKD